MMPPEELRSRLNEAFPDSEIEIVDLTGTRDHYEVRIVAEAFRGVPRIRQHQLVYRSLGTAVGSEIHALSLKLGVPGRDG